MCPSSSASATTTMQGHSRHAVASTLLQLSKPVSSFHPCTRGFPLVTLLRSCSSHLEPGVAGTQGMVGDDEAPIAYFV
jgi:hypothetical protein